MLLPPSETKRAGRRRAAAALDALSLPELDPLRTELVDELVELAARRAREPGGARALAAAGRRGRPQRRAAERHRPCRRCTATPACSTTRSTPARCGVPRRRGRGARLVVGSALFGLLRADDPVPGLPAVRRLGAARPAARSPRAGGRCSSPCSRRVAAGSWWSTCAPGSYAALGRVPGAVTVNVLAERPTAAASRQPLQQGAQGPAGPGARGARGPSRPTPPAVAAVARRAGMRVERCGTTHLDVIVPA